MEGTGKAWRGATNGVADSTAAAVATTTAGTSPAKVSATAKLTPSFASANHHLQQY